MTFSIAAVDASGDAGIAVASKFLAVGAVVPWAQAGVGAVATQSFADVTFGLRGLDGMASGGSPEEVLVSLLANDPQRDQRQLCLVAANRRSATFTGPECMVWAGGRSGRGFAAQGNVLVGPAVVDGMVAAFAGSAGQPLSQRLLTALVAGDEAGGDRRGRQSASLLVARAGGGYGGNHDRYLDLRVDDHPTPVVELSRLLALHQLYFDHPDPTAALVVDDAVRNELEKILAKMGRGGPISTFDDRLYGLIATENLEERWISSEKIDPTALEFLRQLPANREAVDL